MHRVEIRKDDEQPNLKDLQYHCTPVKELISLQRRCSNNLNQVAVHAHTYGVYPEEIDGLKRDYEKLWGEVSKVLRELSELVAK